MKEGKPTCGGKAKGKVQKAKLFFSLLQRAGELQGKKDFDVAVL
jgi:hypothetical protein